MPLYDFACPACGRAETVLARWDSPPPTCTTCAAPMARRPAPFAVTGNARPPAPVSTTPSSTATKSEAPGHTCTAGCSHGRPPTGADAPASCSPYVDSVIKKHLG